MTLALPISGFLKVVFRHFVVVVVWSKVVAIAYCVWKLAGGRVVRYSSSGAGNRICLHMSRPPLGLTQSLVQ